MLFVIWAGKLHRPTKDVDLLGWGNPNVDEVTARIRAICAIGCEDGLQFDLTGIEGARIKEEAEYEGVRVKVPANLAGARVQMQIDVGFGDAVDPEPQEASYPVLLPLEAPRLRVYPPEAMIAEKLHAMVVLGIANSRMRDFFDIWTLASSHTFRLDSLAKSVRTTFDRRRTAVSAGLPFALTSEFLEDGLKQTQWKAFVGRLSLSGGVPGLQEIGEHLAAFLRPALDAARSGDPAHLVWNPPGPWSAPVRQASR